MNLDTYLKARALSDQDFAAMIGCERSFANRLRHGDAYPKFPIVQRIDRATDGQVTAVDLYEARKARLAAKARRKGNGRHT